MSFNLRFLTLLCPLTKKLPLNNRLGAIGDSITAISTATIVSAAPPAGGITRGSHYAYSLMLPPSGESQGGGMIPGGIEAQSGARIQDVVDTHLPAMLARTPKVGLCAVLIGHNDGADADLGDPDFFANAVSQMAYIYDTLIHNDILPIACSTCSNDSAVYRPNLMALNVEIESLANARSIPFADYFTVTDNGVDGYKAGYSDDGIHPNSVGARAMGQELRDVVDSYLVGIPDLVTVSTETDPRLIWTNGCMVDDTDSDGDPDGGEVQTTDAWRRFSGDADCTFALVEEAGVVDGKWWRIEKTANTESTILYTQSGDVAPDVPSGHTIGYGFLLKVLSPHVDTRIDVWATKLTDNGVVPFRVTLRDLQASLDPFKFYYERAVSGLDELRLWIEIKGGTADVYIGQLTMRDLG